MSKKTSEEVLRSVSADLKLRGVTHEFAARKMGYGSKQTLSNLLSSKKYMSGFQAKRFSDAFGYNMEYLMSGEGFLKNEDPLPQESKDESELGLLRLYFRRIIHAWGHPEALKVLNAYQMFESCTDTGMLMAYMTDIEKSLQSLEKNPPHSRDFSCVSPCY